MYIVDACSQERHCSDFYIRDLVTPVNEISGKSHLRSAIHLDISTYQAIFIYIINKDGFLGLAS